MPSSEHSTLVFTLPYATCTAVPLSLQVRQGDWSYFQFSLTLPPGAALAPSGKPSLLVEVTRASGNGFGGDPVLLLMQKEPTGSNRVPWFMDVNRNTDLKSYFLQQNFHYIMQRDLTPVPLSDAPAATGNDPVTVSYYVALYNSDQRFQRDQRLRSTVANLTLRVSGVKRPGCVAVWADPRLYAQHAAIAKCCIRCAP